MIILAINTVGQSCEVALLAGGVEHVLCEQMSRGHDARLAPLAEQVMREAGCAWEQLTRIAVVTGPGSFTGIRVGVSFARGLGLALNIPVLGFTTLEAIVGLTAIPTEHILAIHPAQTRPPALTWWMQEIVEGVGQGEPAEGDASDLMRQAAGVTRIMGGGPPPGLAVPFTEQRPAASIAAKLATVRDAGSAIARPVYVRAPDAAPMRTKPLAERET